MDAVVPFFIPIEMRLTGSRKQIVADSSVERCLQSETATLPCLPIRR